MIELHDGPAEGAYMVKRAPLRLRAVTATTGKDVLNELLHHYLFSPDNSQSKNHGQLRWHEWTTR